MNTFFKNYIKTKKSSKSLKKEFEFHMTGNHETNCEIQSTGEESN